MRVAGDRRDEEEQSENDIDYLNVKGRTWGNISTDFADPDRGDSRRS